MNELFFSLIRVAIGNQDQLPRVPTAREWEELYQMAQNQALIGICFAGVQKLSINHPSLITNLSERIRLQWLAMAAKIQQTNQVVDEQCVALQKRLSADGFRSCLLKGQSNATNYGSELGPLRQSGDIDLWVEGGFGRIMEYVWKMAPTDEVNQHHVQFKVFDDTEVELHFFPLKVNNPWKQKVLDRFCEKQSERQFKNIIAFENGQVVAATNEFNVVFQLMHIYHHLFTEGIGLRQLMDYYFVLCNVQTKDIESDKKVFSDLKLDCFSSALMWVLGKVLGLEEKCMLWTPNEKNGRFLLNEIMLAGNFGHHDERIPKNMSYWKSFWYLNLYNLRLLRFDHWSWFWTPILRIKGFVWRKRHGYK